MGWSLPVEMFGHWQSIPVDMRLLEPQVAEYFAACKRQQEDLVRHRDLGRLRRLVRSNGDNNWPETHQGGLTSMTMSKLGVTAS